MQWTDYSDDTARSALRAWIGEAQNDAEAAAEIEDYRLDLIIEAARRRELDPGLVRLWIFDRPAHPWSPGHLVEWACRRGFTPTTADDVARDVGAAKQFVEQLRSL